MKNVIFAVIAILSTSVCFAENKFEHLFESFAYVDTTPCQTINRFYKQRCEVVAGNSESVKRSEAVASNSKSVERMLELETRQIKYEIKKKPNRDF